MSFNFNYGGMGGYGDNSWLKNRNDNNNQQPTTDDANAFNGQLNNLWGGSLDSLNLNNLNLGDLGSSSSLGDMFQMGNTSDNIWGSFSGLMGGSGSMGSLGGLMGGSGSMGSLDDMLGGLTGDSENSSLGDLSGLGSMGSMSGMMSGSSSGIMGMFGGTSNRSFDISSMMSGFMNMIMGFFSSFMSMFSGSSASGGGIFENIFGGLTGTITDSSTGTPDELEPDNPEV